MDNEEILADFIVEAEEIFERLGEDILELDKGGDKELINSIFRGYHTIKGGASFLNIKGIVDICHECENLFFAIREGEVNVSDSIVDVLLKAQDLIGKQLEAIKNGEDVPMPSKSLLEAIEGKYANIDSDNIEKEKEEKVEDEIYDDILKEFEEESKKEETSSKEEDSEEVSDEIYDDILKEFEEENKENKDISSVKSDEELLKDNDNKTSSIDKHNDKNVNLNINNQKVLKKPNSHSYVRVDIDSLDYIMNMVGELVLVRNRLVTLNSEYDDSNEDPVMDGISKAIAHLNVVTSDIQLSVMRTRMQPIKKVFGRFPRMIRDLSKNLNKNIRLVLEGENTDLDKNLVEELADPLIHLVRNSADHGIESPTERLSAGKEEFGTIKLSASQQGDSIHLSISDDGRGMDLEKIKQKALESNIVKESELEEMSEAEILNLVFEAGLSTAKEVTDISGRGVGLDVVKTKIAKLNGMISIESTYGEGTTFLIKVPLTLAIMTTLMVGVYNQIFAIPLVNVKEILDLSDRKINIVNGVRVLSLRDSTIPLYYLSFWFFKEKNLLDFPKDGNIVIVQIGSEQVGFVVDSLLGQEEVVVKPLSNLLHNAKGLSGATITGNGNISLILDIPSLINKYTKGGK